MQITAEPHHKTLSEPHYRKLVSHHRPDCWSRSGAQRNQPFPDKRPTCGSLSKTYHAEDTGGIALQITGKIPLLGEDRCFPENVPSWELRRWGQLQAVRNLCDHGSAYACSLLLTFLGAISYSLLQGTSLQKKKLIENVAIPPLGKDQWLPDIKQIITSFLSRTQ